ncbi:FxsA family protein [Mesobacillus subterraneus]|uniref:Membrane protein FxsA n=1 Tax=Mesobacillus subterraneus TaxID=285983 RepID=A0A3R9FGW5_9BACI|nr:FxsA family protein [Mesobacillus subterraneus]RSD27698.1 membrane protein FxsA [Mesobacillus subterraneus]
MKYIFLLLVIVPAAEIGVLLLSGQTIGIWPTILLIILTGFIGAYLAKQQGLETIRRTQQQLSRGMMPGDVILDGVSILVGGTLLLTPGFITDALGFLLLAPPTRKFFKGMMLKLFRNWIDRGTIKVIR